MNILISCFSGSNNIGDELILKGLKQQLDKSLDEPDVSVLTLNPDEVTKWHPDIQPVHRPDPGPQMRFSSIAKIPRVYTETDLVIIGGGGLVQDAHTAITIPRYLQSIIFGKLFGCKVVMIGVGVGPISRPLSKVIVESTLDLCDYISVRDEDSQKVLDSLNIDQEVNVAADLAYGLQPDELTQSNTISNEVTGVTARKYNFTESSFSSIGSFCSDIVEIGQKVMFIPFGKDGDPPDVEVGRRIGQHVTNKRSYNVCQFPESIETQIQRVAECNRFVAGRLHAVIVSSILGKPVLGLAYLPKVKSELRSLGYNENQIVGDTRDISKAELATAHEKIVGDTELDKEVRENVSVKKSQVREAINQSIASDNRDYSLVFVSIRAISFFVCYIALFFEYITNHAVDSVTSSNT